MLYDLRQALRSLERTPWLTSVIVFSLALGTGANAAVFSAVDALLFRAPAGVAEADSLVDIYTSQITGATYGDSSHADFRSITSADTGLKGAAAIEDLDEAQVRRGGSVAIARVAAVTGGFWELLELRPLLGDWRAPASAASRAIVISADLWMALGQDPGIVGRPISVGGRDYSVGAVAPARFRGLHLDRIFDVWMPLDERVDDRGDRRLKIVARLGAGGLERLQSRLNVLGASLARTYPETNVGTIHTPDEPRRITALRYARVDPASRSRIALLGTILMGATCLLLLSACVNAGSLLLSRGLARRHELTIKTALGADRARLVRGLLFESVLLAMAGAAAGVLAAVWTAGTIPALFAPEHAKLLDTHVQRTVMLATLAVGTIAGIVFGLAPALISTRALSPAALRGDPSRLGERSGAARLRMSLVAAQLALSTIFLVGSILLTRAVDGALEVDTSHAGGSLVIGSVETYDTTYRDVATPRLRRMSSIAIAGWVATPPLSRPVRRTFRVQRGSVRESVELDVNFASAEYFPAMRMPILDGRFYTNQDDLDGTDAGVVNETLAQRYFADRAVGHVLTDTAGHRVRIVGVVRTRSYRALEGAPQPMVYYPMTRDSARVFYAVVRSHSGAQSVERDVFRELDQAGKTRSLEVYSFETHLSRALATDRLTGLLIAACGSVALALALVGVYGVMADTVRRRTREIGLRIALGARPLDIAQDVVGATLAHAFFGIAAGIGGAAIVARIARTFVFEVPPADPATLTITTAGLSAVIVLAVTPSALRALRVSPLTALRDL